MNPLLTQIIISAAVNLFGAIIKPAAEIDLDKLRLMTIEERMALAEQAKKAIGDEIDKVAK